MFLLTLTPRRKSPSAQRFPVTPSARSPCNSHLDSAHYPEKVVHLNLGLCALHQDRLDGHWPENGCSIFSGHLIHLWLTGDPTQGEIQTHHVRIFGRFPKNKFESKKSLCLCQNCWMPNVTWKSQLHHYDLNVKCAIERGFKPCQHLNSLVVLSLCSTLNSWQIKNYFDLQEFDLAQIIMMTRQQRFHLQTCHEDDLIDLNQKATRIKDLLFGPQWKIYLCYVYNVYYMPVCVYYLQLRASKVFFGNFLKVVSFLLLFLSVQILSCQECRSCSHFRLNFSP